MVTCTTNITLELILQEAPDILDEVDEAPIFSAEPKRMFPSFARNGENQNALNGLRSDVLGVQRLTLIFKFPPLLLIEIKLGKVLGIGGFGVVREVAKIDFANKSSRPINFTIPKETENSQGEEGSLTDIFAFEKDMTDKDDQTSFIMSFEDSMGDGLHYEVSTARETMARRCIRRGEARYAVKALMKEDLTETEYARGRIDLAIEVKYLQALNHPNIVKMRGLFDTDDLVHPHYFFLMDRLYGTLGDRIKEWQIDDKKHRGGIFNKSDKKLMKSLLIKRLTVAYDIVSAVKYMHSCKLVYR
jgi:serine/threonine protein kinase